MICPCFELVQESQTDSFVIKFCCGPTGLSEKDYNIPEQQKLRSYADAAHARNQTAPAQWDVNEISGLTLHDTDDYSDEENADENLQQGLIHMTGIYAHYLDFAVCMRILVSKISILYFVILNG